MEDTKKNEMWGKVMAPLAGFLAIVLVAFLIILKLLESGVIGTVMAMILICVIVAAVFGGIGSIPGAVVGAFIIGICENIIKGLGWILMTVKTIWVAGSIRSKTAVKIMIASRPITVKMRFA